MRLLSIYFIIVTSAFSYSLPDPIHVINFYSPLCYGSNSSVKGEVTVAFLSDDEGYTSSTPSSSQHYLDDKYYDIDGTRYYCSNKTYDFNHDDSKYDINNGYFISDNPSYNSIYVKYSVRSFITIDVPATCEDVPITPSNTIVNGLNFKSNLDSNSQCESMFNDSGDGLGFSFVNPSSTPDECPTGHCYFNTPSESPCNLPTVPNATTVNGFSFQNNYDTFDLCESSFNNNGDGVGFSFITPNNCTSGHCYYNTHTNDNTDDSGDSNNNDNTDDSTDNTTDGTADTVNDISELIPYVDDLETINTNIISSINENKSSVDNVASQVQNSNTILNNILNSIDNLSPNNNDDSTSNDNSLDVEIENDLQSLTNNDLSTNDTNLNDSMSTFTSDYTNILDDSFTTYADVFGFGGYGAKPNAISFDLLGRNYILFDISYLNGYLEHIRLLFSTFAYLFGIFIFFRSV